LPSRRTASTLRIAAATAALAAFAGAASSAAAPVKLEVVGSHLNNPRKLFVGPDRALYVVEAGSGGRDKCLGSGPDKTCIGLSGSITRIRNGSQQRVVTGLWSGAPLNGRRAEGPADVLVRGGTYYVLLQNGAINSHGFNFLGPDGATAGDLIATPPGKAAPAVLVNFAAFEAAKNPDHGRGPGARFRNPPIDSNPYAFTSYRGGYAVVDAAGNDLLWIQPGGKVSVLAVFPTQTLKLPTSIAKQIGAPPSMHSIVVQSVPSCVAVGPDGALYVGELTGVPFAPRSARVWRVVPGLKPTVYASGFTTISDLAFDGRDLLVLELTTKGVLSGKSPGALIRVSPRGARTLVASAGLVYPTGLAVAGRSIYISNYGLYPATGARPYGELVRLAKG
jgi:hypothetical protein